MKQNNYVTEFVKEIPNDEELQDGILYIAPHYAAAVHKCMCGCGAKVVTPLNIGENKFNNAWNWNYIKNVSLNPSIGNFQFCCKSHYFLTEGKVIWCQGRRQKMSNTMTPLEILKILKKQVNEYGFTGDLHISCEEYGVIKKALELQIPKKPEADYYTGKYICPNCHNEVAYSVDDFGNFCSVCGQAIQKEG